MRPEETSSLDNIRPVRTTFKSFLELNTYCMTFIFKPRSSYVKDKWIPFAEPEVKFFRTIGPFGFPTASGLRLSRVFIRLSTYSFKFNGEASEKILKSAGEFAVEGDTNCVHLAPEGDCRVQLVGKHKEKPFAESLNRGHWPKPIVALAKTTKQTLIRKKGLIVSITAKLRTCSKIPTEAFMMLTKSQSFAMYRLLKTAHAATATRCKRSKQIEIPYSAFGVGAKPISTASGNSTATAKNTRCSKSREPAALDRRTPSSDASLTAIVQSSNFSLEFVKEHYAV